MNKARLGIKHPIVAAVPFAPLRLFQHQYRHAHSRRATQCAVNTARIANLM